MDKIEELLTRGVEKIYPSRQTLEKVLRTGRKLRLYQGFDPTGIQLHIGHMVGLMKLRQFQNLGHQAIFLIGDGTGQAGDPSGKTRSREKYLSREELRRNAKDYVLQAGKIVKFEGENKAEILYNSDWLNKLTLVDVLNLAGHFSLQQLEERDLFIERKKKGIHISFREFLYPLLQGYDSVAMNIDLEIGGTDQTFNMLTGRKLVKEILGKEKYVLTTPLLTDSIGKKIGKTEGNVIALTAKPNDFYGMIMNLPDDVIIKCFELITDLSLEKIKKYESALKRGENPMLYKKKLAFTLVEMLNSKKVAAEAEDFFEKTFQKKKLPLDIPIMIIPKKEASNLVSLLVSAHLVPSRSEAKRLIKSRAVEINGKMYNNQDTLLNLEGEIIVRVGKHRFVRLNLLK